MNVGMFDRLNVNIITCNRLEIRDYRRVFK